MSESRPESPVFTIRERALLPANAVDVGVGAVEEVVAGDGGRGGDAFAQVVGVEEFELRASFDDEGCAVIVA
jgi:hypothetical protein